MTGKKNSVNSVWPILGLFGLWFFVFFDAISSAAHIWYISEIFTHGFFIIPGAMYFIWRERSLLVDLQPKANYWVLVLIVPFILLSLLGRVGGIQVFEHAAAFIVLTLLFWFLLGNKIVKVIWFPLCFVLFSIPVGEELVPFLQKITADIAVFLLGLTAVPSFNSGLYIEIPQGKFVVAEACSGIRFFVGSIVFGAVYAHLSYRSFKRKCTFMLLAIFIPIIANALRVFTIVLIGHFVDMKYASGADHLVYGWVFFGIVLFLLILLGETFREKTTAHSIDCHKEENRSFLNEWNVSKEPIFTIVLLLVVLYLWQFSASLKDDASNNLLDRSALAEFSIEKGMTGRWGVIANGYSDFYSGDLAQSEFEKTKLVLVWYPQNKEGKELISSQNALYDKDSWSIVSELLVPIDEDLKVSLLEIVSDTGQSRFVLYWYQFEDKVLVNKFASKIYQSIDVMFSGDGAGALVALSLPFKGHQREDVKARLISEAGSVASKVRQALPF